MKALDNEWQIGAIKNYASISEASDEDYFKRAISIFERDGRVEYLPFVYMEYAKFLKKLGSVKYIEFNEKARYLFDKLGYKEYIQFCE